MIVGRKAIIEYLKPLLGLSGDQDVAWRKVYRWRERYAMEKLFHHAPNGRPYLLRGEVEEWLRVYEVVLKGGMGGGYSKWQGRVNNFGSGDIKNDPPLTSK